MNACLGRGRGKSRGAWKGVKEEQEAGFPRPMEKPMVVMDVFIILITVIVSQVYSLSKPSV